MNKNSKDLQPAGASWRYGALAVILHWLLALLIAGLIGLGWYMMTIEDEPGADWYFNLHRSVGLLVLALVVVRMAWRAKHRPAELPASLPPWQVKLASVTQWLLYTCMAVMPLTGFTGASLSKSGVAFFGLALPRWAAPNHDLAEQFFTIHSATAWVLVGLVALHAAGGLKHLFINRDRVFQRMWF